MKGFIKGEALRLLRTNSSQRTFECKLELPSLHDFYGSWHLYICHSLFGHSTFFVASLVFMKGTSCCVIRRNFKWNWAVRYVMAKFSIGHRSTWFQLLSACRFVELDTSVICHVFMHCFGSFLLLVMFLSLQEFVFKGQNMKLTIKMLFTCILRCDARPGCD